MSTKIRTVEGEGLLKISGAEDYLETHEVAVGPLIYPRADFLKAVAAELDVIVVERSELPEVQPRDPKRGYNVGAVRMLDCSDYDAAECRATGLRWLALAEYMDANPPVDEAQVERIAKAVRDEDIARGINVGTSDAYLPMAASLYRGGIRAPEVTP